MLVEGDETPERIEHLLHVAGVLGHQGGSEDLVGPLLEVQAQKALVLKQGEGGTPVAEICRKAGISQATYFNWKKKYAGLMPSEMKRPGTHLRIWSGTIFM